MSVKPISYFAEVTPAVAEGIAYLNSAPAPAPAPALAGIQPALAPLVQGILDALQTGTAPWVKPWGDRGCAGQLPRNYFSGRRYSGINVWALSVAQWAKGYDSPEWATYRQWSAVGGQVRKGEKGTQVVFYSRVEAKDKSGALDSDGKPVKTSVFIAKAFTVFNIAQVDNAPASKVASVEPPTPNADGRIPEAEAVFAEFRSDRSSGLTFAEGGNIAYYSPTRHHIGLPEFGAFANAGGYYATLYHEAGHSTGSDRLLKRADIADTDGKSYAREELTAELASALCLAHLGIGGATEAQNSVSYCAHWAERIKADPQVFVRACSLAEKAFALITGASAGADSNPDA